MELELKKQRTDEALTAIRRSAAQLAADGMQVALLGSRTVLATPTATDEEPTEKVLYNSRDSDVLLIVHQTGQHIHAHEAMLGTRSDFFKTAFEGASDDWDRCLSLDKIPSVDMLHTTLNFLYTGKLPVLDDWFMSTDGATIFLGIMENARYFLADTLTEACCAIITRHVATGKFTHFVVSPKFNLDLIPATLISGILTDAARPVADRIEVASQWAKGYISTPQIYADVQVKARALARELTDTNLIDLSKRVHDAFSQFIGAGVVADRLEAALKSRIQGQGYRFGLCRICHRYATNSEKCPMNNGVYNHMI